MLNAPSTGAEADRCPSNLEQNRRRSCQIPVGPHETVHRRLPHLFGGRVPGSSSNSSDDASDDEEDLEDRRENFLGRVHSYSKLMHAHTSYQLSSLSTGTLPSYTKTMHAFTLNQLNHHRNVAHCKATQSAKNSPQLSTASLRGVAGQHVMLPSKVCTGLDKLTLDDAPHAPSNTPVDAQRDVLGSNFRSCLLYTSPSPRDGLLSRMPSSA